MPVEPATEQRVSEAAIDQYIFRAFVDLVGNAPSEAELSDWRGRLRTSNLDTAVRRDLVTTLQQDPSLRPAYVANLYQGAKVRFLENFPDAEIERRFIGLGSPEDDLRLRALLGWQAAYLQNTASVLDLQASATYNLVFDEINMGSFNYVRATFDNLLWRYPTNAEFEAGFAMVEASQERRLFARTGASKSAYSEIVSTSPEALEGTVIWQYDQLLARRPSAAETLAGLPALERSGQVEQLQITIITSTEYAGF